VLGEMREQGETIAFLATRVAGCETKYNQPLEKFARTLRQHQRELLHWFAARGLFAYGATEGFNG
jgi:hypothetical protein